MKNILTLLILTAAISSAGYAKNHHVSVEADKPQADTIEVDSLAKYTRLTDDDYRRVAEELGVETATIKAVVEIEAGTAHKGFAAPGIPLINFDATVFRRNLSRAGKSYSRHAKNPAFRSPDIRRHGSYGMAQWARLENARTIDVDIANVSAFWGMFQIGGFNWKKCGCKSVDEFVNRMSESEAQQLELFAQFCKNSNLVQYLKTRNWSKFAYYYNGPSYRSRGYHTKLNSAYRKHSRNH